MLSGLPGAGKDTLATGRYVALPQVSLDALRVETGAGPTGNQGRVIDLARQRAREHLRTGEPFVYNATNLLHAHLGCIGTTVEYGPPPEVVPTTQHTALAELTDENVPATLAAVRISNMSFGCGS